MRFTSIGDEGDAATPLCGRRPLAPLPLVCEPGAARALSLVVVPALEPFAGGLGLAADAAAAWTAGPSAPPVPARGSARACGASTGCARPSIASFSRALTEGLRIDQSAAEFDATLDASIAEIYAASIT